MVVCFKALVISEASFAYNFIDAKLNSDPVSYFKSVVPSSFYKLNYTSSTVSAFHKNSISWKNALEKMRQKIRLIIMDIKNLIIRWRCIGLPFLLLNPTLNQTGTTFQLLSCSSCRAWFTSIVVLWRILLHEMWLKPAHS